MRLIIFIFSILLLFSCTKEISDGPYIYFSNEASIPDTISQSDAITFEITAIGQSYKVTRAQVFVNTTEYFDTTFAATDSITFNWVSDFSGKLRTQNVMIQAIDESEMIGTQTKKIYIEWNFIFRYFASFSFFWAFLRATTSPNDLLPPKIYEDMKNEI